MYTMNWERKVTGGSGGGEGVCGTYPLRADRLGWVEMGWQYKFLNSTLIFVIHFFILIKFSSVLIK